jgi:hypothetical protein
VPSPIWKELSAIGAQHWSIGTAVSFGSGGQFVLRGHLHHDSMVASVIILSAFRNFGRTHHVFTSIRRFSTPREHGDQTIATVVSQGLYRRRRALALPDARPECGAVWRDRLARGRLSGGRRLPHHGRDRLRRRSPPDTARHGQSTHRGGHQAVVDYANGSHIKVQCAARAVGQTLIDDGIVVDSTALNAIECTSDGTLDAQAGALWGDVAKARMGPPAASMPDAVLSVGGTLSVGGSGERLSVRPRSITRALDVITGSGVQVSCSAARARAVSLMLAKWVSAGSLCGRGSHLRPPSLS